MYLKTKTFHFFSFPVQTIKIFACFSYWGQFKNIWYRKLTVRSIINKKSSTNTAARQSTDISKLHVIIILSIKLHVEHGNKKQKTTMVAREQFQIRKETTNKTQWPIEWTKTWLNFRPNGCVHFGKGCTSLTRLT